jgi:hypothetical protein
MAMTTLYETAVELILETAHEFVAAGTPYLFGGNDINGCDCSGLVVAAYAAAGLIVPRFTGDQLDACFIVDEPQPGDLVFSFGTDDSLPASVASHVQIVSDRPGCVIEAPSEGLTVREVPAYPLGNREPVYGRPRVLVALNGAAVPIHANQLARVAAADGLNLRVAPTVHSPIIVTLPAGTFVAILRGPTPAGGYEWWYCAGPRRQGWLAGQFLEAVQPLAVAPGL